MDKAALSERGRRHLSCRGDGNWPRPESSMSVYRIHVGLIQGLTISFIGGLCIYQRAIWNPGEKCFKFLSRAVLNTVFWICCCMFEACSPHQHTEHPVPPVRVCEPGDANLSTRLYASATVRSDISAQDARSIRKVKNGT